MPVFMPVFLCSLALALGAVVPQTATAQGWQEVTSAEGHLKAAFPFPAKTERRWSVSPGCGTVQTTSIGVTSPDKTKTYFIFFVCHALPKGGALARSIAITGTVTQLEKSFGKVIAKRDYSLGSYSGVEFVLQKPGKQTQSKIRVLIGAEPAKAEDGAATPAEIGTLYQIGVVAHDGNLTDPSVDTFLNGVSLNYDPPSAFPTPTPALRNESLQRGVEDLRKELKALEENSERVE